MTNADLNPKLTLKYFPFEVENHELFVALGDVDVSEIADGIITKLRSFPELKDYLDEKLIRNSIKGIDKHRACYLYLGDQGRQIHLIYLKYEPYLSTIMHEVQHMIFRVMELHDLDVTDHSGEEYFCMQTGYWFNKLIREFPIKALPQHEPSVPING